MENSTPESDRTADGNRKDIVLLIDGNSIINRAYYALQSQSRLITKDGFPTFAIYGFLNIYQKYADELKPTHVCVAFDVRQPTFRHLAYEGYKAKRKGMPEDLAIQLPVVKEVIDAMGIPRIEFPGYEADDLLGTLSKISEENGARTTIVTGDRDALQLLSDQTFIKIPITRAGKTETEEYTVPHFEEKYGVSPRLFVDVKGLMGDSSDNIPGVAGIGEKTAFALVQEFGGLEEIYTDTERIAKKSVREKMNNGRDDAFFSRKLATIDRDVPCEMTFSDLKTKAVDRGELFRLFNRLEFRQFIQKMGLKEEEADAMPQTSKVEADDDGKPGGKTDESVADTGEWEKADDSMKDMGEWEKADESADDPGIWEKADESTATPVLTTRVPVKPSVINGTDLEAVKEVVRQYETAEELVLYPLFDKEDSFHNRFSGILCYDCAKNKAVYIFRPYEAAESVIAELLRPLLYGDQTIRIGHDVKQLYHWAMSLGMECPKFQADVMLAGYVAEASAGRYGISELASYYLNEECPSLESIIGKGKSKLRLSDINTEELAIFASTQAIAIKSLAVVLLKKILEYGQDDLYYNIELPLAEVLAFMEVKGFYVDVEGLKQFSAELNARIETLTAEIYELAGEPFNVNSFKQLGVILFEKLGLKSGKKTKSGYSTDIDALEGLRQKHPIIEKIIEYRQYMKLKSTYADGLATLVNPETGRIHTTLNQAVTATGRISSTEPNLQNIPVKLELGREIRRLFTPQEEGFVLLGADYSQIELRVLAHIAEDAEMIEAFRQNLDIHTATAAKVFGVPESEVTPAMRRKAKAVNFGIVYGIGEFSLSKDIGVTVREARAYIENYLSKYKGVHKYMSDAVKQGRETGTSVTIMNRRRSLPEINSPNHNIRSFGERVAMNTPIQGSAADIIKIAMVRVYRELKRQNLRSAMILQVHDELIIETAVDEFETVASILKNAMEKAVTLNVPLIADLYYGWDWKNIKNPVVFDEANQPGQFRPVRKAHE